MQERFPIEPPFDLDLSVFSCKCHEIQQEGTIFRAVNKNFGKHWRDTMHHFSWGCFSQNVLLGFERLKNSSLSGSKPFQCAGHSKKHLKQCTRQLSFATLSSNDYKLIPEAQYLKLKESGSVNFKTGPEVGVVGKLVNVNGELIFESSCLCEGCIMENEKEEEEEKEK